MPEVSFVTPLHVSNKRDYLARMTAEKPECMRIAKQFGKDYWDGDRRYGYGGYKYDGRWKPVAEIMASHYGLAKQIFGIESWPIDTNILDIGCGKGFLLQEFKNLSDIDGVGFDLSAYALDGKDKEKFSFFNQGDCINLPYNDYVFDLTYSINVFHNLGYKDLKSSIKEMVRVTKPDGNSYICVESYRNEEELCNLQCWALTCLSFYSPDDWLQIYEDCGYKGDYEFIYFQ